MMVFSDEYRYGYLCRCNSEGILYGSGEGGGLAQRKIEVPVTGFIVKAMGL